MARRTLVDLAPPVVAPFQISSPSLHRAIMPIVFKSLVETSRLIPTPVLLVPTPLFLARFELALRTSAIAPLSLGRLGRREWGADVRHPKSFRSLSYH